MEYHAIYLYFGLVLLVTALTLGVSAIFQWRKGEHEPTKFLPYESGIQTTTDLFHKRYTLHYYLVALLFLIFDVEVVFLYPWAVIAKKLGSFAFYEMTFFLIVVLVGLIYAWRKGGLQWE